jgi:anaerobic selenocysteine-containing dehydrogenase
LSTTTHHTYCRLCEVGCGLAVDVADGHRIERIRPDGGHPVTAGFACNKGLLTRDVHHDPDRLDHPLLRTSDGGFARASWDDALDLVATRLGAIVERHGPSAVAAYLGNPTAFNATAGAGLGIFLAQLGSDRMFTAGSQDCANKYAVGELLWGSAQVHLVADVDRTDHVLLLGTNPRVSKGSFLSMPDPVARLAAIRARGGTVVFVDPRVVEPGIGETVQIRPDTDAYLLAAMLVEIDRSVGFDGDGAARVDDLDRLRAFLADFSPERVAPVVGVPAETIVRLAREFAAAPTASAHLSTGVNMGRHGALAYWLLHLLVLLTGNLDRPGGNIAATRGLPPPAARREPTAASFVDSPWGRYRPTSSMHPGALLAEFIDDPDEPVRALVVSAGNPLLSVGGGSRLQAALERLELLVSIDLYRNATAELADVVLPACDWYERADLNTFVQGVQVDPFLQITEPLVPPVGERREEWQVWSDLLVRMGHTPFLDPALPDVLATLYDGGLATVGQSVASLRTADRGTVVLPRTEPGGFLDRATVGGTGRIDGAPEMLADAFDRARATLVELEAEPPDQLKLVSRRTLQTLNSALQNVGKLKERGAADNPLLVCPADAERLGLHEGDAVRVTSAHGCVETTVRFDPTLRTGAVAMTHGFGNQHTPGMPVAQAHPGVNVNALMPTGPGSFDPVSTMSQLTGVPVTVAPVV